MGTLSTVVVFLVIAIIAGVLGFGVVSFAAAGIAKILFFLFLIMFIVSLTGWMVATTFRVPMTKDLLGVDVPAIVTTVDRSVRQWIEESHMVLAYLLAAVVLVHVIGALRHHMLKHNDVLRRMTWSARA